MRRPHREEAQDPSAEDLEEGSWPGSGDGSTQLRLQRPEAQGKGSDTLVEQDPRQPRSGGSGIRGISLSSGADRWGKIGLHSIGLCSDSRVFD